MKRTVGAKLYGAFICILILMASLGWISYNAQEGINKKAVEINESWLPKSTAILHIKYYAEHFFTLELQYIMTSDLSKKGIITSEMDETLKQIDQEFAVYEKNPMSEEERKRFLSLKGAWKNYQQVHQAIVQQTDQAGAQAMLIEADTMFQVMEGYIATLVKLSNEGAAAATQQAAVMHENGTRNTLVFNVVAVVLSMLLAYYLARNIRNPLREVVRHVKAVAEGDLGMADIRLKNRDELGELAANFNEMRKKLREIVKSVNEAAEHVSVSSVRLNEHAKETLHASSDIALSLQEIAAGSETAVTGAMDSAKAMEEMSAGIQRVAESTATLAEASLVAEQDAREGNASIVRAANQMSLINEAMEGSAVVVSQLGDSSKEIQQVVGLISEIASQTNLLALNAAIEAARAGEFGRGFAVVADEVRNLAEQSDRSARHIASLVEKIQADTAHAVEAIQAMAGDVNEGTVIVREAGGAFEQIVRSMGEINEQVQEVSAITEQMSASVEELTASAEQTASVFSKTSEQTHKIVETTNHQVAASEEVTSSTEALKEMAQQLKQEANWFKV
ncbi:MAG TPA: HAMP domain-containing methyl-accepting chemotaxis protein [Candidatus Bathyarchaeia archaeon]|nr:HAMP domain-containing methyl-accepting chemotaxis protein [Candidatus Bathyarchaeia archaeon]